MVKITKKKCEKCSYAIVENECYYCPFTYCQKFLDEMEVNANEVRREVLEH